METKISRNYERATDVIYRKSSTAGDRAIYPKQSRSAELGEKPYPKELYSVDRIDNDSHYMVGNVRWTTAAVQANNRRTAA
jgi:hypothetical protein